MVNIPKAGIVILGVTGLCCGIAMYGTYMYMNANHTLVRSATGGISKEKQGNITTVVALVNTTLAAATTTATNTTANATANTTAKRAFEVKPPSATSNSERRPPSFQIAKPSGVDSAAELNATYFSFCTNNSTRAECCSESQCKIVRQSSLYSACCNNIPTRTKAAPQTAMDLRTEKRSRLPQALPPTRIIPILITATPRSGTVFVQTLLRALGIFANNDSETPPGHSKAMVSWLHVMKEDRDQYFGGAKLMGSKFQYLWHQTRDPLRSLTSIAFTEPLSEKTKSSQTYMRFLQRHVNITGLTKLKGIMIRNNTDNQRVWDPIENKTMADQQADEILLIHRGMEFFLAWHSFILSLNVPLFALEDLTVRHNYTILDDIFKVLGRRPPTAERVKQFVTSLRRRRRRRLLQRQLQLQQPAQRLLQKKKWRANNTDHVSRAKLVGVAKGTQHTNSRKHRPTLQWGELCRVSAFLAKDFLHMSHRLGYYHDMETVC